MKIPTTIYKTVTGSYHLPTSAVNDCMICKEIIANKVFEGSLVDIVISLAKPDSIILDCGGCYGQMSVRFSPHAKKVYCFEMNPDLCEIIVANLDLNNCHNVEVVNAAVWNKDGEILTLPTFRFRGVDYSLCYGSYHIDNSRSDGHKVRSMTIDSLNLDNVGAMKFDIQGADLRGMMGAMKTIQRCRPGIVFEYEVQATCEPSMGLEHYLQFLDLIGYRIKEQIGDYNFVAIPK